MGTSGWGCPSSHRSRSPPAFCPSIAGPQKHIRGDFGVDELRPSESTGLPLPPPSHSVPNPESLSPSGQGHSSCKTKWFELILLQDPSRFQPNHDAEISEHHPRACDHADHPPHPRDSEEPHWDCQHWMLVRSLGGLKRHRVPAGSKSGWSCTLGQLQAAKPEVCSTLEI